MAIVAGSPANDVLTARAGDSVSASAGDDVILVGDGTNNIDGGPGIDTLDYELTDPYDGFGVFVLLDWGRVFRGPFDQLPEDQSIWFWDDPDLPLFEWQQVSSIENVSGTPFPDRIYGALAGSVILGENGDDTLGAVGRAPDVLRGGPGNDLVDGNVGFDDLHGNEGDDTVSGWDEDDWVVGGKGDDILSGDAPYSQGPGNDVVLGNLGNDTCNGDGGSDLVRGGQGNDVLLGQAGNDWLSGDRGDDTITGGAGADIFHTFGDAGIDRVTDFSRAEGDRVQLDPGTTYTLAQVGSDTVISMSGGAQMILVGVSLSSLTRDWIFAA